MAMGLASINAMPAMGRNGALMIQNNYNSDRDLKDGWSSYNATLGFGYQDNIGQDENGKLTIRKNRDLNEVKVYKINNPNVDEIFQSLLEEVKIPYEDRPVHESNYIFTAFTNHKVFNEDQIDNEPLLERVYLDHLSKQLDGAVSHIDSQADKNLAMNSQGKEGFYPLETRPRSTPDEDDSSVKFPLLASMTKIKTDFSTEIIDEEMTKFIYGEDEQVVED